MVVLVLVAAVLAAALCALVGAMVYWNVTQPLRAVVPAVPLPAPYWRSVFLGHFGQLLAEPPGQPYVRWMRAFGDVVLFFGHLQRPRLAITDPAVLKDILVQRPELFDKSELSVRASKC